MNKKEKKQLTKEVRSLDDNIRIWIIMIDDHVKELIKDDRKENYDIDKNRMKHYKILHEVIMKLLVNHDKRAGYTGDLLDDYDDVSEIYKVVDEN